MIQLGIGLPLVEELSHTSFWDSFVKMEKPESYAYLRPKMPCYPQLDEIRNGLAVSALEAGCSHLLMMDTDQIYPLDSITRLIRHAENGCRIVGAKVHRRYPPFDPLLMRWDRIARKYYLVSDEEWSSGDLIEVDATGTGMVLIDCEVFEEIPWPWFKQGRREEVDGYSVVGEDVGFCELAKRHGYSIHVDCSIKVGHIGALCVNEDTYRLNRMIERNREADHGR